MADDGKSSRISFLVLFGIIFLLLFAFHIPLLRLPYFWDEAGYYIPAARDLWLTGSLVPHSTPSNAHPPLVMAYLALWWKAAGFTPLVTRTAMLVIAAFALTGVFRVAERIANREVAIASTLCTALYPVFFAQSSLAHLDVAASAFVFWGLLAYVNRSSRGMMVWFSLAVLSKETAVLVPASLFAWGVLSSRIRCGHHPPRQSRWSTAALIVPLLPLALWYVFHYSRSGYLLGNPEFVRYNVQATLHPLRVFIALLMRLWQTLGYMNLFPLTAAALMAIWIPPIRDGGVERPRIAFDIQFAFLAMAVAYIVVMSIVGGAVLARYMLPIVPLVIIVCVSTLRRRVAPWRSIVGIVATGFLVGLFVNPPYGFSLEDNLAYRDYILLHMNTENFIEARYPMARVLTAWPASDELARPALGYVTRPVRTLRIKNFTAEELMSATDVRSRSDLAMVFSTKYQPRHAWLENFMAWQRIKTRFFGYHRDLTPEAAALVLGGQIVYSETRNGQWAAVIEMRPAVAANCRTCR